MTIKTNPTPDMGMNPWLIAIMIPIVIFISAIPRILLFMAVTLIFLYARCLWWAWRDVRAEKREERRD